MPADSGMAFVLVQHLDPDYPSALTEIIKEFTSMAVINATEGGIPSSRAETTAQLDEELRLFYVALTRAKTWLTVSHPRTRSGIQGRWGNWDDAPTLTRFLPSKVKRLFQEEEA